jgi:ATP-binding cassette, subfamily B, bacterial
VGRATSAARGPRPAHCCCFSRGVSLVQQFYFRVWVHFAANVMQRLVNDGFFRVQRFSADWHANNFAGSTVRKISRGMWAYDTFADTVVIHLGPALTILIGFAIAMFLRDPLLGAYFSAGVFVFLSVSVAVSLRYVAPANRAANDADTRLGGALADAITCNSVVKAFGAEAREETYMDRIAGHWRDRARRAWRRSLDAGALQSLLILALLGGLLAIVLTLAQRGTARLDDLVSVLTAYFIVNGYLRNVGMQVRNLQRSVNELDDLVAIHQLPPQVANAVGAEPLQPRRGHIRFEHVRFRYENQPEDAFEDLDLEIAPKEKVALVGESGAGKTTLVKLLQRLYDLKGGRILIDGRTSATSRRRACARESRWCPRSRSSSTVRCARRPDASDDEIVRAARKAHAHAVIVRLADGYDSMVGERGISGAGRSHVESRFDHRAPHPGGDRERHGRADGDPHRTSALDGTSVRPHPGLRSRPHRRAGHPRRVDGAGNGRLPPALRHAVARVHRHGRSGRPIPSAGLSVSNQRRSAAEAQLTQRSVVGSAFNRPSGMACPHAEQ